MACPRSPNAKRQIQDENTDWTSKSAPHLMPRLGAVDTVPFSLCTSGHGELLPEPEPVLHSKTIKSVSKETRNS